MEYNIKKKDLDTLLKSMKKILTLGDGIIISGNVMHPVPFERKEDDLKVNGNTSVLSPLPFNIPLGVTMVTVMNIRDVIGFLSLKKNIKLIMLIVDDHTIRVRTDDEEIIIATTNKEFNGLKMSNHYSDFRSFLKLTLYDDNEQYIGTRITPHQVQDIKTSRPVTLISDYGKVRISKNLFPLTGPIKSTDPNPFQAEWVVQEVEIPSGSDNDHEPVKDYVLVLHVKYKDLEAVHLYAITPF